MIEVEVLVVRRALELALEIGFDNIILEGDLEILFKALKNGGRSLAQYGHLTRDILLLSSHFSVFNLSLVLRHCNKLAHSLARRAQLLPHMSI